MKLNHSRLIAIALFTLFVFSCVLGTSEAGEDNSNYTGSRLPVKEAIVRSNVIALAVLQKLGFPLLAEPGSELYDNAKFKVTKLLKGTCGGTRCHGGSRCQAAFLDRLRPPPGQGLEKSSPAYLRLS